MLFKAERIRAEWFGASLGPARINPTMKEVALDAITFAEALGWDPMLTCILRTPAENDVLYGGHGDHFTGVHVDGRGVDIRTVDVSPAHVAAVVAHINQTWVYAPGDPTRVAKRCAFLEDDCNPGSSAPHLHLQVFPTTAERTFG